MCLRQSFVVGPKFCGVKMLPPGPHLVSYNSASSGGAELAPTTSFFVHVPARSVTVRRWDAGAELLAELDEEEVPSPYCMFSAHIKPSLRTCVQLATPWVSWTRIHTYRDPLLAARQSGTLLACGSLTLTLAWRRTTWPPTRSGTRCPST